jgi:hypothetical protein
MILAREVERCNDYEACFKFLKGDGSKVTLGKF